MPGHHDLQCVPLQYPQAIFLAQNVRATRQPSLRASMRPSGQADRHPTAIKAAEQTVVETVKRSAMQTGKRASSQVVGRISCQMARPSLRRGNALWKFLKEDDYLSILPTTTGATCLTSAQPCV